MKPPIARFVDDVKTERIQQLNVWTPGELELHLISVYSPIHSLMWMATTGSNWILMFIIMGIVGLQVTIFLASFSIVYLPKYKTHMLINSFEGLIKDKAIIAAEVMHEYDEKVNKTSFCDLHALTIRASSLFRGSTPLERTLPL